MMATTNGLLDAICESPEDVALRLIFADWCEENGQEQRAELIRVQCELARLGGRCLKRDCTEKFVPLFSCCLACDMRRRDIELRSETSSALDWLHGGDIEWDGLSGVLHRGFIEEVSITLEDWLEQAHAIQRATPLRVLRLRWESPPPRSYPFYRSAEMMWRQLICDDEPRDNPVCRLHTLDISRLAGDRHVLHSMMNQAYRSWRGLKCLILPNWSSLEERYRGHEIEQWKKRVATLESVLFV